MLSVNNLSGFGSGDAVVPAPPITSTYISTYSSGVNARSYTVTGANLGTPFPGRLIVIGIMGAFGSNSREYTAMSVGGVAATRISNLAVSGAIQSTCAFFAIQDSTNTTANIVANSSADLTGMGMAIWALSGVQSIYPTTTNGVAAPASVASISIPITMSTTGVCLVVGKGVGTMGITGFNLNANYAYESTNAFVAGDKVITLPPPGATNITMTSTTANYMAGLAVFYAQG